MSRNQREGRYAGVIPGPYMRFMEGPAGKRKHQRVPLKYRYEDGYGLRLAKVSHHKDPAQYDTDWDV